MVKIIVGVTADDLSNNINEYIFKNKLDLTMLEFQFVCHPNGKMVYCMVINRE